MRHVAKILVLSILLSGCSRMTIRTYEEYPHSCTEIPLAPLIDTAALVPIGITSFVFFLGGLIIMEHNAMGGLGALLSAGLAGTAGGYTIRSSAYGWSETAKCRREMEKQTKQTSPPGDPEKAPDQEVDSLSLVLNLHPQNQGLGAQTTR